MGVSDARGISALLIFLSLAASGCGAFQRSTKATHVEDEPAAAPAATAPSGQPTAQPATPISPQEFPPPDAKDDDDEKPSVDADPAAPPQKFHRATSGAGSENALAEAQKLFTQALKSQNDSAYVDAQKLWQDFITRFPGFPGFEQAQYNLALCSYLLGNIKDVVTPVRSLLSDTKDPRLAIAARLLLAETEAQLGNYEETLSLTYEVLPNPSAEAQAGFKRTQLPPEANLGQKMRLYILRGRAYTALGHVDRAATALNKAQSLWQGSEKDQLSQEDRRYLPAALAWRRIEIMSRKCSLDTHVPPRLSEAEFLAYADAYYACAAPARVLFCDVVRAKHNEIKASAIAAYRALAEAPLELKDHLPPPARQIRKKAQKGPYEREMKALIEKTVREREDTFRNLSECGAFNVY